MVSFSRRLDWGRAENALAAAEARRRASGEPLLDLTESNPTAVGLDYPAAEIAAALARPGVASYRPSPRGPATARRLIAGAHAAAGRGALDAERLVLTASSSESYAYLLKLLCDPGDALLVPEPSYPLFDYLARLEGVVPIAYRLAHGRDGWRIDLDSVDRAFADARALGTRPAALVVVSPNNPTGSVLRAGELAALDARADAAGAALIADEVFADYVPIDPPDRVASVAACPTRTLTFSLGGLSKSCGLPQLKLGWIAVGGPAPAAAAAVERLELVADTYLSVAAPVTEALPDLLLLGARVREAIGARVAGNRRALAAALAPLDADGGWCAILRLPPARSDEAWALMFLEQDGVLVHPGYLYDLDEPSLVVVSLLPRPEIFAEAIARMRSRVAAA